MRFIYIRCVYFITVIDNNADPITHIKVLFKIICYIIMLLSEVLLLLHVYYMIDISTA